MKLEEYSRIIGKDLIIRFVPDRPEYKWFATFDHCDLKGIGVLIGTFGNGHTPEEALKKYAKEIRGKTIVFNAYRDNRQEFKVPEEIE